MKKILNISIVLYHTREITLKKWIDSINRIDLDFKIYILDNSATSKLKHYIKQYLSKEYIYFHFPSNLGFGKAHNVAMEESIKENTPYHLVINPDVFFHENVIEKILEFMEENKEVGLLMPKVLYPNGNLQYLCKLLPTPFDLFGRRFLNFKFFAKIIEKRNEIYELRFTGYNRIMEIPYLSGCFMFLRTNVLKRVGLFDERFFMYMEDVDLSRRIYKVAKNIYFPYVSIYHEYGKGSYKSLKLLYYHIESAIKYFNKWGWFIDPERDKINRETLIKLGYNNL